MQQIRLLHQLALLAGLFGLFLDHLTGRSLRLRGEFALQCLQIFGGAQHFNRPACVTAATRMFAGRQLLLH